MGIGASGSSLGGIIYPIIFRKLQPQIGFPWTTRRIAFVMLATSVLPVILTRTRRKPSSQWKLVDLAAWRELPYLLLGIGLFFTFMGLYILFFYVQTYVVQQGIMSEDLGFYLLAILNVGSFFGRIVLNYIADKIGLLNVCIACGIATSVLGFAWIAIEDTGGIIIFSILYGCPNIFYENSFFSDLLVSLPPAVVVTLSPHPGVIGLRLGMLFVPIAFGLLIGNPIAGAILKSGHGNNWKALEAFCGSSILLSVGFLGAARVTKVGWGMKEKS
ncbi:putative mfs monocarboxylate transporter protein [Botrytis fragariae]|uniref:Putative mfs monocarboxylate transporter protein n=1 Tax=Botrytis fragariae TaxID=1964551 RepID=A0A8H6ANH7_9HELO|nr:putative mfs monocarboxylate transporter protein [Botrytis fragariae]KAF5870717.1 putative mfs monocarboxylate transporter protein [Botrytis fragariae]